jgi:sigma-B regulation protein RsbU (phosphoserine phosphatase)
MNGISSNFRPGLGLKAKFSILMALFTLIAMGIVNFYFAFRESKVLSREVRLRGESIARNVALNAEDPLSNRNDLLLSTFVYDAKANNEGVVYCFITDRDQKVWASTDKDQLYKEYIPDEQLEPLGKEPILVQPYCLPTGEEVYDIGVPVKIKETTIGEVHLGISRDAIKKSIKETSKGMALFTVVTIVGGVVGILVLVSFIIGSLGRITKDIEAIGNGDLEREIVIWRRDEIGRIANSVREMAIKLKIARKEVIEKEKMKKEMQIARKIQQTLLPQSIPKIPGLQIESYYESAKDVGGDYFDFIEIDKDRFGAVVADVSGKGVAGSLIMTMVRTILRREALISPSPHSLISLTNYMLRNDIPDGMFVTLFYVMVSHSKNQIVFSCAGHNPAFLYKSKSKEIVLLKPKGPALGIPLFDERDFAERLGEEKLTFAKDDILALYTDGITEAQSKIGEQYGEERLKEIILKNGEKKVSDIKVLLLASLKEFTGGTSQSDDITFVLIKKE